MFTKAKQDIIQDMLLDQLEIMTYQIADRTGSVTTDDLKKAIEAVEAFEQKFNFLPVARKAYWDESLFQSEDQNNAST